MTHPDVAAAVAAELETLSRECRLDAARLDAYLAPDFHEIGASGREITKEGTAQRVAEYTAAEPDLELVPEDVTGTLVADGVVLVRYALTGGGRRTLRTSLWRRTDGGWQMFHHQGTVVP